MKLSKRKPIDSDKVLRNNNCTPYEQWLTYPLWASISQRMYEDEFLNCEDYFISKVLKEYDYSKLTLRRVLETATISKSNKA